MKDYPEESKVWDLVEATFFGAICLAGAGACIYYMAYFIVTIFGA